MHDPLDTATVQCGSCRGHTVVFTVKAVIQQKHCVIERV